MKKILSLILFVVLVVAVFAVAASATSTTTEYWEINPDCLVKAKTLDDGTVPTFKLADGEYNGLLVGLPVDAEYKSNDRFFEPIAGYTAEYFDNTGKKIDTDGVHLGTTDKVVVYDDNNNVAAQYGLVTYGDADGDGFFDAIDAYIASLCLNGHIESADAPDVYEAVKPRLNYDNAEVDEYDYQKVVNDVLAVEPEENLKGRKKPVNETIDFESIIYACDGNAKTAAVSIPDANFKKIVEIAYNGSSTAPTTPGIYSITAIVPDGTDYLVTPGTKKLGFMIVAPKTATGYSTTVDNANKKITININNFYTADTTLDSYISSWYNSAYSLTMAGNSVSSGEGAVSALSPRTVGKYWHETVVDNNGTTDDATDDKKTLHVRITDSTDVLGCYLPDDFTLWNNVNAQKTVPVSVSDGVNTFTFDIAFGQNSEKINELDRGLFFSKSEALRPQRKISPYKSTGVTETNAFGSTKNYKQVFAIGQRKVISETNSTENVLRTVVGAGNLHPTLLESLGATGLKTILLGNVDTIMFVSADKKSNLPLFSTDSQVLYDADMRRYSDFTADELKDIGGIIGGIFGGDSKLTEFLKLINGVLDGLNITLNATSKTSALIDKTGWVRYACADDATGLRYVSEMYLEFRNVTADDDHKLLLVTPVDGCTITTSPTQSASGSGSNVYYTRERMIVNEPFKVTAKLAAGYKLSVTDANGNPVSYDEENGWYIMPASNVTVTAVPE